MFRKFCFVLSIILVLPALADAGELLWEMNLNDYEPGPAPEFGKGLEIRVEDEQRMLSKQDNETLFFPANMPSGTETKHWNDIVFQVRYREHEKTPRSGISLVVKKGGERSEAEYLWYYVSILSDGASVRCHNLSKDASIDPEDPRLKGSVRYEDIGETSLMIGEWITAEIQVGEEVIKISVNTEDGSSRKMEFKTLPGKGGTQIMALTPVDVLSASVRNADAPVTVSE